MRVTKEQLKTAVLSQVGDTAFLMDLVKSMVAALPPLEQQQLINYTMVELGKVDAYYIAVNTLTKIQYIFLSTHEVYMHIKETNPSLTKGAVYAAISRGYRIKNYRVEKIKRGL